MTQSMTAYSRQQSEFDWGTVVWEIRSVNHRYLETNIRLPESLRALEIKCRDLFRANLKRGKVDAQLRYTPSLAAGSLNLNQELLSELNTAKSEIVKLLPDLAEPTSFDVLKWPGMIQETKFDAEEIAPDIMSAFKSCVESLQVQRETEGAQLKIFVEQRLQNISLIVNEIKTAMPEILKKQHAKLKETLDSLKDDLDPSRLEQEMVLLAQKADISEETDRLEAHVTEVTNILKQSDAVGRKLDFLMQELNREANTICSKSIVTETTLNAVELKVLIEQMREQIQNIE